jgi:hypothetical protein
MGTESAGGFGAVFPPELPEEFEDIMALIVP